MFTTDTDTLVLEDESMRVKLETGDTGVQAGDLVNGVVAGVLGKEENGGKFRVEDLVFAKIPGTKTEPSEEDINVCVMSGLELGGSDAGWIR